MNSFLPEGYKVPKQNSGYMKLKVGQNKFRILSAPAIGYEYWNLDGKPVRSREEYTTMPTDIRAEDNGNKKINHFWAFIVYNADEKKIEILEITQNSILSQLEDLINSEDWGDPREYTLTVKAVGEKLQRKYTVVPSPKASLPDAVKIMYEESKLNLDSLFEAPVKDDMQVVASAEFDI